MKEVKRSVMTFEKWGELAGPLSDAKKSYAVNMLADWQADREKLIGTLFKIKRDIYEPDKIYIHLSRALGKALEKAKEKS